MTVHFVMMGVCGCGKTTAALALQRFLNGCPYAEGDEFHTQENRDKMDWMTERSREGVAYSVVTCSALKRSYRDILRGAEGKVVFVHLTPPQEVNLQRMMARKGHYMKAGMLDSQLEILEELDADEYGVKIGNPGTPEEVEADITAWVEKEGLV